MLEGSYDELLVIPGFFDLPGSTHKHARVTRIYVSQKDTCYNGQERPNQPHIVNRCHWDFLTRRSGRKNWGIPKHLARFSFSHPPSGPKMMATKSLKVEVFPPNPSATTPFFVARLEPIRWAPSMPFSTKIAPYMGLDVQLVQPPLQASEEAGQEELTGSDGWLKTLPYLYSPKARLMRVDLQQPVSAGNASHQHASKPSQDVEDIQKWWPAIKPWSIGLWLEDSTLVFGKPERLQ